MDPRLEKYLEYIITKAHGATMPEALKEKMIADLFIQLEGRLTRALLDRLPPREQMAYNNLLEQKPSTEQVQQFFEERLPTAGKIIEETVAEFEHDYLETMGVTA